MNLIKRIFCFLTKINISLNSQMAHKPVVFTLTKHFSDGLQFNKDDDDSECTGDKNC